MSAVWRITTTLLMALSVTGALAWYVVRRAAWAFVLPRDATRALALMLGLGLAAAVLSRTLGVEYGAVAAPLGAYGGAVMLGIVLSALLLLPVELTLWLLRAATRWRGRAARTASAATPPHAA